MRKTFSSLSVRNYRLFFYGQLVSLIGTWTQTVAQAWLVLRLSHNDGFALGLLAAAQFLPLLVLSPWAGLIADRFDKRRVLIATQTAMGILAGILAVLTIAGVVSLWMVFVLAMLLGLANAFDVPTRQAFVSEMVGSESLANAVGLNSSIFNAARIVGPAVGAVVIKLFDVGPCFAINSVSFAAVIAGLMMMRPEELQRKAPAVRARGQIREGLRYAWRIPVLRSTLFLVGVVGTLAFNFVVVLPLLARRDFHGDAGTYGLLTAVMGVGSLVGALITATRSRPTTMVLLVSCGLCGIAVLGAAAAPSLVTEIPALMLAGATSITFIATANTTLQLASAPEMRGRVMAIYVVLFLGSTPIGGPLIGWISGTYGARSGLAVGGVAAVVAAGLGTIGAARNGTLHLRIIGRAVVGTDPSTEPAAA